MPAVFTIIFLTPLVAIGFTFTLKATFILLAEKNNNIIQTTKANRQACALSVTVFCQTAHHVVFKQLLLGQVSPSSGFIAKAFDLN